MVLLVVDGWAARLIAEAFASIRRTARNWVRHDRDRGTDGLSPGKTRAKCAAA
jgi:transposase